MVEGQGGVWNGLPAVSVAARVTIAGNVLKE